MEAAHPSGSSGLLTQPLSRSSVRPTPEPLFSSAMRPVPARILLSALTLAAFAAGAVFPKLIFFVLAAGSAVLLATSLFTSRRPLTRALQQFQSRAVEVRLWGVPPPGAPGPLILTAVNALGAGAHVFFSLGGGASMHLKVAQPQDPTLASTAVVIRTARYVQWNGQKIPRVGSAPAVSIALTEAAVRERPGSVA